MVLLGVLTTLMVPKLTKDFINFDYQNCIREIKKNIQLGFLLITILISFITSSSYRLSEFLYLRGNMNTIAIKKISNLSIIYSWTIIPVFVYSILGLTLLSLGKGKLYALTGSMAQILMIFTNIFFYQIFDIYTFTISLFISHLIAATFMFFNLDHGKMIISISLFKYMLILISVSFLMFYFNKYFTHPQNVISYLLIHLLVIAIIILSIIFSFNLY